MELVMMIVGYVAAAATIVIFSVLAFAPYALGMMDRLEESERKGR